MKLRFPTGATANQLDHRTKNRLGKPLIPGAIAELISLDQGTALLQSWQLDEWELFYWCMDHTEPVVLELSHIGYCSVTFLLLDNDCKWQDFISGVHFLKQKQVLSLTVPNVHCFCVYKPARRFSRGLLIVQHLTEKAYPTRTEQCKLLPNMAALTEDILCTNYTDPYAVHADQLQQLTAAIAMTINDLQLNKTLLNKHLLQLQALKKYIDEHLSLPLGLKELSRICTMNSRQMNLAFKELYGCTINHYIRTERLRIAKEAILQSDTPLKTIAKNASYQSYANFCTAFRIQYGLAPAELRTNTTSIKH
jgi:AraC-like DNA-binding protein